MNQFHPSVPSQPILRFLVPSRRKLAALAFSTGLLASAASQSQAQVFTQNATGLAAPTNTVTFSELNPPPVINAPITTQFQQYGITFSSGSSSAHIFYAPTYNQNFGTPNIDPTASLGNFIQFSPSNPVFSIRFTRPVTEAALAIHSAPRNIEMKILLQGVPLTGGTHSFVSNFGASFTNNFIGVSGTLFDEIRIDNQTFNAAMVFDNVQFTPFNNAPTDISLSPSTLAENNAPNATVGTLGAMDIDAGQSHTFSLVAGTGDADNAAFTITGATLKINASADYETKSSCSIRVRATDSGSPAKSFEKALTVTIANASYTLADWKAANFTLAEQADPAISGSNANPDCDGLPNAVEYVKGSAPKSFQTDAILSQSLSASPAPRFATYTLRRLKDLLGVIITLEVSSSPSSGFTALAGPSVRSFDATTEEALWWDNVALSAGSARYARLVLDFGGGDVWTSETFGQRCFNTYGTVVGGSNGETYLSNPYVGPRVFQGTITDVGISLVNTACQPPAGTFQDGEYFLLLTSGPNAGTMTDVLGTTPAVFLLGDDLTDQAFVGDSFEIRKHASFDGLFGPPSQSGLAEGLNSTVADLVQLVGTNRVRTTHFYFNDGVTPGWLDNNFDPAGHKLIMPEQGFIVRRGGAANSLLYLKGTVPSASLKVPVEGGDNLIAAPRDRALTLDLLGLYTGDPATGVRGALNAVSADNLIVVNPNGSTTSYFYSTRVGFTGWRTVSLAASGNVVIPAGGSFYLRRKGTPAAPFSWSVPSF